jgi:hypothetical protein
MRNKSRHVTVIGVFAALENVESLAVSGSGNATVEAEAGTIESRITGSGRASR